MREVSAGSIYQTPGEHHHMRGCRKRRLRMTKPEWHREHPKISSKKIMCVLNAFKKGLDVLGGELGSHGWHYGLFAGK